MHLINLFLFIKDVKKPLSPILTLKILISTSKSFDKLVANAVLTTSYTTAYLSSIPVEVIVFKIKKMHAR